MKKNKTIGEIVAQDYRTAEVFKKAGIDFCCGGKQYIISKSIDFNKQINSSYEFSNQKP